MPQAPRRRRRVCTLDLAGRMLPLVRVIVRDLVAAAQQARAAATALAAPGLDDARRATLEAELGDARARLADLVRELTDLGVELKDVDRGLVDFPAVHEGRMVLLCWPLGEARNGFRHELTTGFAGRRPIAQLSPLP